MQEKTRKRIKILKNKLSTLLSLIVTLPAKQRCLLLFRTRAALAVKESD